MASQEILRQTANKAPATENTTEKTVQRNMDLAQKMLAQSSDEPVLIGIYGIGGSGVEHLKSRLEILIRQRADGHGEFQYFDLEYTSKELEQASKQQKPLFSEDDLDKLRNREIANIREVCRKGGKAGIIFGLRPLSRDDVKDAGGPKVRSSRWGVDDDFSAVLYYSASPSYIVKTLCNDPKYAKIPRKKLTQIMVKAWDIDERESLETFCASHRVPMESLSAPIGDHPRNDVVETLVNMILVPRVTNQQRLVSEVVGAMDFEKAPSNAVVLIEAHNILARDVTSTSLWDDMLSKLASQGLTSVSAFRRDMYTILREENGRHEDHVQIQAAEEMTMDPELERLLWQLTHMRIPTVILTCGLPTIWREVLRRPTIQKPGGISRRWTRQNEIETLPGFDDKIKVIGRGRTSDDIVVAPEDKAAVVKVLREKHGRRVYVIGGTELDVPMLKAAGQDAFIRTPCVGELHERVRALSREHGGQATYIEPREGAFHPGRPDEGRDICNVMGLKKEGGEVDGDGISEEGRTELQDMLDQAQYLRGSS